MSGLGLPGWRAAVQQVLRSVLLVGAALLRQPRLAGQCRVARGAPACSRSGVRMSDVDRSAVRTELYVSA